MDNYLKIISLGGFGQVTKNMFVYETPKDILIVDCGVGFPEREMLGVDLVVPDVSYLLERQEKIRGLILSHGHDDHIGGLPYFLPQLKKQIPIYGPKWAIGLSKMKLEEIEITADLKEFDENTKLQLGDFSLEFIEVTHSIPDTYHLVIKTPVGIVYHAADFKLDLQPVMGQPSNQGKIKKVGQLGVLCLLSDCLRAENQGFTPPEVKIKDMFESEIANCPGKFVVTTMSSNISRWKLAIDVSLAHKRKIVLVGRTIEKNMALAQNLKYLEYPEDIFVKRNKLQQYTDGELTFLVAGSQAQTGSSLDKIVAGDVPNLEIKASDKIIFSTDYIPGNESAIYRLIDNIYRLGGEVVYQDIHSNVHVSGHGSQGDLGKLMEMVKPKYLIPIGGNFRHMHAYRKLALSHGFQKQQVIIMDNDQVVEFNNQSGMKVYHGMETREIMVDALGVGDVGKVVLRDRKILSEEGMVVAVISLDQKTFQLVDEPEVISRGFVYIKENFDLINQTKKKIRQIVGEIRGKRTDTRSVRFKIQEELEKFFQEKTGRRPMVLPVIIEA
jgi:ribonuclease J